MKLSASFITAAALAVLVTTTVNGAGPAGESITPASVAEFMTPDGHVDMPLLRQSKYQGNLDISGYSASLDAQSGEPVLTPLLRELTDYPADSGWSGEFHGGAVGGNVISMVVYNGELIVGGKFQSIGDQALSNIAAWNGTSWSPLGQGTNGQVNNVILFGSDLIASGIFTTAGGVSANNIARWNGSTWSALGTGTNNIVYALVVFNSELYVGGEFTEAGGDSANFVAKWDGSSWTALSTGMDAGVYDLKSFGGEVIAGGWFTTAGGTTVNYIAKWDGSNWVALGGGMSYGVNALEVHDSKLIAAGDFAYAGGVPVGRVAQWDGASWSAVGTGFEASVYWLYSYDTKLYAGGTFLTADGNSAVRVASWNGSAWSAMETGVNGLWVTAFMAYSGYVYVGGRFGTTGGLSSPNLSRWTGSSWLAMPGLTALGGSVYGALSFRDTLYIAGDIRKAGPTSVNHIARWDGSAWNTLGTGFDSLAYALVEYDGQLVVGGRFINAGGVSANKIARWNGSNWQSFGTGMNGTVRTLRIFRGDLVAAGAFTTAGGSSANRIARWNGATWAPLAGGVNGSIVATAIFEGDLIVAGTFTEANGLTANRIARWDGSAWSALPGGGTDSTIWSLGTFGNDLIVGGGFIQIGGISANRIALFDGTAWSAMGTGMPYEVYDIDEFGGALYAAGRFYYASDTLVNFIARWEGGSLWSRLGSGFDNSAFVMAPHNERLVSGGAFSAAGDKASFRVAAWAPHTLCGDADQSNYVDIADVSALVNYLYRNISSVTPDCDIDDYATVNIRDLARLIESLFLTFIPPSCSPSMPRYLPSIRTVDTVSFSTYVFPGSVTQVSVDLNYHNSQAVYAYCLPLKIRVDGVRATIDSVSSTPRLVGGMGRFSGIDSTSGTVTIGTQMVSDPISAGSGAIAKIWISMPPMPYDRVIEFDTAHTQPHNTPLFLGTPPDLVGFVPIMEFRMDTDHDGYADPDDNCPLVYNPAQQDDDYDSVGNVCDNCPAIMNVDQEDADGDGIGDACDNCPFVYNPGQEDGNGNGIGDVCDPNFDTTHIVDTADVYYVRQADLDKDNRADIIYTGGADDTLYVAYGRTDGSLDSPRGYYRVGKAALTIDFINADTLLDIVAYSPTTLYVMLNLGGRSFSIDSTSVAPPPSNFRLPTNLSSVAVASGFFNNDAFKDIVCSPDRFFPGNGSGRYMTENTLSTSVDALDAIDLNQDGIDDIVGVAGDSAFLYLNNGTPSLTRSAALQIGFHSFDVATVRTHADFNLDGNEDFAVIVGNTAGIADTSTLTVVLGNGAGGIISSSRTEIVGTAVNMSVADVNKDGRLDVSVINADSGSLVINFGDGSGGFSDAASFAVGTGENSVLALVSGDLNRDGSSDFLVGGQGGAPLVLAYNGLPGSQILDSQMITTVYNDARLRITNPEGLIISRQLQTVAGAAYWRYDIDGNGAIDNQAYDYNLQYGLYTIVVGRVGTRPIEHLEVGIGIDGSANFCLARHYNGLDSSGVDSLVFFFDAQATSPVVPASGVPTTNRQPTLSWPGLTARSFASTTYRLQLDRYYDFRAPIVDINDLAGTSYLVPSTLGPDSVYYWRVKRSVDADFSHPYALWITGGACCLTPTGNIDCDPTGGVDIGDLTVLIDNLFISFAPLCCEAEANCDGLGGIDIGDLTKLIDNLFITFTPLAACQ